MRLGIFHPAFGTVGGAELLVAAQVRYFHSQGVAPEVVTLEFDPARWATRLEGIPIHTVRKRHWTDVLSGWSRMAKLHRRGKRAAASLKSYDLVIAHGPHVPRALELFRGRLIAYSLGNFLFDQPRQPGLGVWIRLDKKGVIDVHGITLKPGVRPEWQSPAKAAAGLLHIAT